MAVFKNLVVIMALMLASAQFHNTAAQTTHTVGGSSLGWTVPPTGPSAYTNWASGQTFAVGDVLVFNFATGAHTVAEVSQAAYGPCTAANPISVTANGPARLTLNAPGTHYFICTVGTHCQIGQKLAINVSAASAPVSPPTATLTPAPTPSTITTPPAFSPAPSQPESSPSPSSSSSSSPPTYGPSATGSPTTLPPSSPSGVAPSYAAVVPLTLMAIALAFFY